MQVGGGNELWSEHEAIGSVGGSVGSPHDAFVEESTPPLYFVLARVLLSQHRVVRQVRFPSRSVSYDGEYVTGFRKNA